MTCKVVTQICFLTYFPSQGFTMQICGYFHTKTHIISFVYFFQSSVLDTQSPCSLFSLFFKEIWIRSEVVCTKE